MGKNAKKQVVSTHYFDSSHLFGNQQSLIPCRVVHKYTQSKLFVTEYVQVLSSSEHMLYSCNKFRNADF